jgi:hypothetical protein
MTATEIIRKAMDNGYRVRLKGDEPRVDGRKPIPDQLMSLLKNHRTEIIDELKRRRSEGELPPREQIPSKDLQRWVIVLVKSGRQGMVMIDGVPVGVREEAESLLGAEEAWEGHNRHTGWVAKAMKLREALEWPFEESEEKDERERNDNQTGKATGAADLRS